MLAKEIFLRAIAVESSGDRRRVVRECCQEDIALLNEVERLLTSYDRMGTFLQTNTDLPIKDHREDAGQDLPVVSIFGSGSDSVPYPGLLLSGVYECVERLGKGGMGEVWKAKQQSPVQRFVAVKFISSNRNHKRARDDFEREQRTLSRMQHPNIARVYDHGFWNEDSPFLVLEYISGKIITEYCNEHCLTIEQRLELFLSVCRAVEHSHQRGVIHCDIKPANVMVSDGDEQGVVKLLDFGIAGLISSSSGDSASGPQHVSSGLAGTPGFTAPERLFPVCAPPSTCADIYSLGQLLRRLLSYVDKNGTQKSIGSRGGASTGIEGAKANATNTVIENCGKSRTDESRRWLPFAMISQVDDPIRPPDLAAVVQRATASMPEDRYPSIAALIDDLSRYLVGQPVSAYNGKRPYRIRKWFKRHKYQTGFVLAMSLSIILGGVGSGYGFVRAMWEKQEVESALRSARVHAKLAEEARVQALEAQSELIETESRLRQNYRTNLDTLVTIFGAVSEDFGEQQRDLLRRMAKRWELHAECQGEDEASLRRRAEGKHYLASLLGTLGEQASSLEVFQGSIAAWEHLIADFPEDREYQRSLAGTLAIAGMFAGQMGRKEMAREYLGNSIVLAEALSASDQRTTGDLVLLVDALQGLAMVNLSHGWRDAASTHLNKAAEILESVGASELPIDLRLRLASVCTKIGQIHTYSGDYLGGSQQLTKAIEILLGAEEEYPENREILFELAVSQSELGDLMRISGDLEEARKKLQQSQRLYEQLNSRNAYDLKCRFQCAMNYNRLGIVENQVGNLGQAAEYYRTASQISESLLLHYPQDLSALQLASSLANNLGILAAYRQDYPKAEAYFRLYVERCEDLLELLPDALNFQENLRHGYTNLGSILCDDLQYESGVIELHKALEILARSPQGKDRLKQDLSYALLCINIGRAYHRTGSQDLANSFLTEAEAICEGLVERGPGNIALMNYLAEAKASLAAVRIFQHRYQESIGLLRDAEMILEQIGELNADAISKLTFAKLHHLRMIICEQTGDVKGWESSQTALKQIVGELDRRHLASDRFWYHATMGHEENAGRVLLEINSPGPALTGSGFKMFSEALYRFQRVIKSESAGAD